MLYTQEQIDRANQTNLVDWLRGQGERLDKSGKDYRWKRHDSVTIRENRWFRHSQQVGGYPVDFVMEFYNCSFPDAVEMLTGMKPQSELPYTESPQLNNPTTIKAATDKVASEEQEEFYLPEYSPTSRYVKQYLIEERCIDPEILESFLSTGNVYEDHLSDRRGWFRRYRQAEIDRSRRRSIESTCD